METAYQDENGYYFDPPVEEQEEEERYYYHQPLTHHYHHHNQDFAAAESHFYRIQQQDYSQESFVTRIFMLFNTRGALISLAISIGVILFTQHKDDVRAWFAFYFPRNVAITDSLRVLALQGMQLIYGWLQYFFSGALWERLLEWTRRTRGRVTFGGGKNNDNSQMMERWRNQTAEPLPELELVPILPGSVVVPDLQHGQNKKRSRPPVRHAQINTAPLAATFLRREDYPASWMVYHRVLGVVKKTEADDYDQKMMEEQALGQNLPDGADECMNEEKGKDEEEKKDDGKSADIDDEKTVHHSNVSMRNKNPASSGLEDSSSPSDNNNDSSAAFPVLHSIVASG